MSVSQLVILIVIFLQPRMFNPSQLCFGIISKSMTQQSRGSVGQSVAFGSVYCVNSTRFMSHCDLNLLSVHTIHLVLYQFAPFCYTIISSPPRPTKTRRVREKSLSTIHIFKGFHLYVEPHQATYNFKGRNTK